MRPGLAVKHYLPNLTAEALEQGVECMRQSYDRAPRFAAWLMDALLDEQTRRLQSRDGEPRETALLVLPAAEWTAEQLVQGMLVCHAMSYGIRNENLGQLVDKLVAVFTSAVGSRLMISEHLLFNEYSRQAQ
jgi:hypothetical protein